MWNNIKRRTPKSNSQQNFGKLKRAMEQQKF